MSKRYGSPYDREMRESEHGARLYNAWKRIRRSPYCSEWEYYPTFYLWAMQNGYVIGMWLKRIDDSEPYGPKNCYWSFPNGATDDPTPITWADEWNKTANRIRKHYGMPPLEGTEYDV